MSEISSAYPYDVDPDAEIEKPEGERFRVDDDGSASWALRRLAEAEAELASREAVAAAEIATVERWLEDASKQPERDREFFSALLVDYMARRHEADPKTKTISLPAGKLTARAGSTKLVVVDPELFFEFADAVSDSDRPVYVREKVEPNLADLKKCLAAADDGTVVDTETGEPVPGLALVAGATSYSAKPSVPDGEEA